MNKRFAIGAAVAASLMLGAGAAVAAIPDSGTGVFTACVANNPGFLSGDMRNVYMIDKQAGGHCSNGYTEKQWNQTGPVGPQGEPGPQGEAGPAGDSGVSLFYTVTSPPTNISPGLPVAVSASCSPGDRIISGGGFESPLTGTWSNLHEVQILRSFTQNSYSWDVVWHNTSASVRTVHAQAICADITPEGAPLPTTPPPPSPTAQPTTTVITPTTSAAPTS